METASRPHRVKRIDLMVDFGIVTQFMRLSATTNQKKDEKFNALIYRYMILLIAYTTKIPLQKKDEYINLLLYSLVSNSLKVNYLYTLIYNYYYTLIFLLLYYLFLVLHHSPNFNSKKIIFNINYPILLLVF
jgi:hypothetical protein